MTIRFRATHKSGFAVESPLQPFTFPGGEAHIKIPESFKFEDYTHHTIIITGQNPQDLFLASMFSQVLLQDPNKDSDFSLVLPYLPAARADRGYPNLTTYAEFVTELICPARLVTIDPHSPVWVNRARELNPDMDVVEYPVERVIKHRIQDGSSDAKAHSYVGVIAPDAGARDRASRAAKVMGVPVYQAGKKRDEATGKLSGFHMEDELPAEGKLLIVDDICDGGGTFIGLAEATGLPKDRVDLWVTHGIFSKGFDALEDHFGTIHTTDSYFVPSAESSLADCKVVVHPILATLEREATA